MKKRVLSIFLVLLMVITLVPANVFAAENITVTVTPTVAVAKPGDRVTFTANVQGTANYYYWFTVDADGKAESPLNNKSRTFTISNITDAHEGMSVYCVGSGRDHSAAIDALISKASDVKSLVSSIESLGKLISSVDVSEPATIHVTAAQPCDPDKHVEGDAPTCTRGAICSVCGQEYGETNPDNHLNTMLVGVKEATVEEEGYTGDRVCTDCGAVIEKGETVKKLCGDNHVLVKTEAVPATCTEKGMAEYWTCSECGAIFSDADGKNATTLSKLETDRDKTNHTNLVEYPAKAATCKEAGNIHYYYCDGCKDYFSDAEGKNEISHSSTELPKLDHKYVWEAVSENGAEYHQQKCTMCGNITKTGNHTGGAASCVSKATCTECGFTYGEVDKDNHVNTELRNVVESTETTKGYSGDRYCTDCGVLVEVGHETDFACIHELTHFEAKEATCQETGSIEYWKCSKCGKYFSDEAAENEITKDDTVVKTASHHYVLKYDATFHWMACQWCDASPVVGSNKNAHQMDNAEPTCCSGNGCRICEYDDGQRNADNHSGGTEIIGKVEATDDEPGYSGDTKCLGCGKIIEKGHVVYAKCPGGCTELVHHDAVPVTCTEDGNKEYWQCSKCGNCYLDEKATLDATEESVVEKCTGHDIHPGIDSLSAKDLTELLKNSNLTDLSYEQIVEMIKNGSGSGTDISIDSFLDNVKIKDIDHCYDDTYHWLGCQRCGKTLEDLRDDLESNGIVISEKWYELSKKTAHSGGIATCKEKAVCDECGESYGKLGEHRYNKVEEKATCTKGGTITETCTVCGEKGESVTTKALGHKIEKGRCTICREFFKNPFYDVLSSDYFYQSVMWAYYFTPQITAGVDSTHFNPNGSCTRAQFVTFLWRAAGKPTVSGNTAFTDIKAGEYYYEAVRWAVSMGITNGTSKTTFSPNATVTRGQVVTFLWRYYGNPMPSNLNNNPFNDVSRSEYYYYAVLWAVENSVTKGTSDTTFSPTAKCTRAQTVTFMQRAWINIQ